MAYWSVLRLVKVLRPCGMKSWTRWRRELHERVEEINHGLRYAHTLADVWRGGRQAAMP